MTTSYFENLAEQDAFGYSDLVLENLVGMWNARFPTLADYLLTHFGYRSTVSLPISRLFIAQMADADVAAGNIGGLYLRKWVLRDGILDRVALNYDFDKMYETDPADTIYLSPSFLYCQQGDSVLLSERYGSSLKHRQRGQINNRGPQPVIEWETVWRDTAK